MAGVKVTPTKNTATATLAKWGNSQGFIVSKSICKAAGFRVGDTAKIEVDEQGRIVFDHVESKRYERKRMLSLEEFAAGWTGKRIGEEWSGPDVGAEVVP
jgi:antitoxin component of MazEF toxin-antitoxin module